MTTDREDGIDWDRLARYVAGESSATEASDVERWASADPRNAEELERARAAWAAAAGRPGPAGEVDTAWARMSQRMDEAARPVAITSRSPRMAHALRVAAAIVVLVGGGLMWRARRAEMPVVPDAQRYATTAGERREIVLPDSTRILLGVASEIAVAAGYGQPVRDVALRGEAKFTVTHDAARPFRVTIGGRVIEDLGTEFSLRAHADADTLVVDVTEGVVSIRHAGEADSLIARAGQVAMIPAVGAGAIVSRRVETLREALKGRIVFDNATLAQVAAELPRWFDVEIRMDPSLASRHVTAPFEGDTVIGDVVEAIAKLLGVRVETAGRVVTFRAPK
jgi:transmembrane sensor